MAQARENPRLVPLAVATAISVLALIGLESRASACSCIQPGSPRAAAAEASVVFEGRTFGVHRDGTKIRFTFEVSRVFKGEVGRAAEVHSAASSSMCGRTFETGLPYLVYARSSPDGVLLDSMCSRTRASRNAAEDFAELGAGTPPPRPDALGPQRPSIEAPRIEPAPPPASPSKRGCTIADPHEPPTAWWLLLSPLVAPRRRRLFAPGAVHP